MTTTVHSATGDDHARMIPRLFLEHFGDTSLVVEDERGLAATTGCRMVRCVTSPVNTGSIAFHRAMGFDLVEGDAVSSDVPIHTAYDGPGEDRVVFRRAIP